MKNVTVVAHPVSNLVITPSTKNPDWGTFRVDSSNTSFENGIVNISKRSAFVRGRIADLDTLNLRAGQTLPGKIVKRESFEPFYEGQPAKINPTTKEVVLTAGKETFLEFVYSSNPDAQDEWIGVDANGVITQTQEELAKQGGN